MCLALELRAETNEEIMFDRKVCVCVCVLSQPRTPKPQMEKENDETNKLLAIVLVVYFSAYSLGSHVGTFFFCFISWMNVSCGRAIHDGCWTANRVKSKTTNRVVNEIKEVCLPKLWAWMDVVEVVSCLFLFGVIYENVFIKFRATWASKRGRPWWDDEFLIIDYLASCERRS